MEHQDPPSPERKARSAGRSRGRARGQQLGQEPLEATPGAPLPTSPGRPIEPRMMGLSLSPHGSEEGNGYGSSRQVVAVRAAPSPRDLNAVFDNIVTLPGGISKVGLGAENIELQVRDSFNISGSQPKHNFESSGRCTSSATSYRLAF